MPAVVGHGVHVSSSWPDVLTPLKCSAFPIGPSLVGKDEHKRSEPSRSEHLNPVGLN